MAVTVIKANIIDQTRANLPVQDGRVQVARGVQVQLSGGDLSTPEASIRAYFAANPPAAPVTGVAYAGIQNVRRMGSSNRFAAEHVWEASNGTQTVPLSREPEVTYNFYPSQEEVRLDRSGNPVVLSNGLPFEDPPLRDVGLVSMTYTRNVSATTWFTRDAVFMYNFAVAINSDTVTIAGFTYAPRQVKMRVAAAQRVIEGSNQYYRVTYYMEFAKDWDVTVAHYSRYEVVAGPPVAGTLALRQIAARDGGLLDGLWPLTSGGTAAVAGAAPHTSVVQIYPRIAMSGFGWA